MPDPTPTPAPGPAPAPDQPAHRQVDVNVHRIDPQAFDPTWLKIIGSATAVGLICVLFTYMVVRQINNEGRDVERSMMMYQQLQDRDEQSREREGVRMRDWMKSKDDRIGLEVEKLKLEVKISQEQLKTVTELVRAIHERGMKQ